MNAEDNTPSAPVIYVCPFCGGDRWIGLGEEALGEIIKPAPVALPAINEDGTASAERGYAVVGIACTTCGFVRLHSTNALRK